MSWNPISLRGISFLSQTKKPAFVEFQEGLNVICGASDTGKSFVLEAIDFMLASTTGSALRDIKERIGYDRVRLVLQAANGDFYTFERPASGGNFVLFEGDFLTAAIQSEGTVLRPTPLGASNDSVSTLLLSLIDLPDKYLRTNKDGKTRRLGFRNLVRMSVVEEHEIIKRSSPILSEDVVLKTGDYATFKLLLTGVDDSALNKVQITPEPSNQRTNNSSKIAFIEELVAELKAELNDSTLNRRELEERLWSLETGAEKYQESLTMMQERLDESIERRKSVISQVQELEGRTNEINGLISRFELLKEHYQVDLKRLTAIEESGTLFVHLNQNSCPLCGALPSDQHVEEKCDGNVDSVVQAAKAESEKINKLLSELNQTIEELKTESRVLTANKAGLDADFRYLNQEIQSTVSPLKEAQIGFGELMRQSREIEGKLDKLSRIQELEKKKSDFLAQSEDPVIDESEQSDIPVLASATHVELSASILDEYAQKVQNVLKAWHFPNADRVFFDEKTRDIIIDGKPRTSRGKGLRAITHAAMTIALMEFCLERNLAHPGFVILDSPLLAYYEPEGEEDSLIGSDLKDKFYEYLAAKEGNFQVIVIENEHPSPQITGRLTITNFTKNPNEGRYGFFPHMDNK